MINNSSNLHKIQYLARKIKDADDKKYYLTRILYGLNDIGYEKGSWQSDYTIRDKVQALREVVNRCYNALKLFDIGKNGDLKAFGDVLIFFRITLLIHLSS